MKAKILKTVLLVILMTVSLTANSSTVTSGPEPRMGNDPKIEDARAQNLINRLEEIKAMTKSDLTRAEKKELRKEVKSIKKELKATGNGVYLSVGAIIIVILLLILIL